MTADEFERAYAERSGISVGELRSYGRVVRRCSCEGNGCVGWKSISKESAEEEKLDQMERYPDPQYSTMREVCCLRCKETINEERSIKYVFTGTIKRCVCGAVLEESEVETNDSEWMGVSLGPFGEGVI